MEEKRSLLEKLKSHFAASSEDATIVINVGGTVIDVRRELIDMHVAGGGTFALISGKYDHLLPKDKNGRIFLDLDLKWVKPFINWAQDMTMWDGVDENMCPMFSCDPLSSDGMDVVQVEYQSSFLPSDSKIFDSEILKAENLDMDKEIHDWLDVKTSISSSCIEAVVTVSNHLNFTVNVMNMRTQLHWFVTLMVVCLELIWILRGKAMETGLPRKHFCSR